MTIPGLRERVSALAKQLCPGCRDHLYIRDAAWHVYADGSREEKCRASEIEGLIAPFVQTLLAAQMRAAADWIRANYYLADVSQAERYNGDEPKIIAEYLANGVLALTSASAAHDVLDLKADNAKLKQHLRWALSAVLALDDIHKWITREEYAAAQEAAK